MRKAVFVSPVRSLLKERIRRIEYFSAVRLLVMYGIMVLAIFSIASEAAAFAYYNDICGHTWTKQTSLGKKYWWGIASSIDGTRLAAIEFNGYIYTSNDNGTTWTQQMVPGQRGWVSITSSYDGKKIAAVENDNLTDGGIWQGSYNGNTWNWSIAHATATNYWTAVTSSGDGGQIYAGDYSGHVYSLANNWNYHSGGAHIYSIAASSDGTDVYTGTVNGWFHYSLDNGTTFTAADGSSALIPSYGARFWWSIATGSSGGSGDIFAVDGSGGNVIYLILNVLTPTVDTGLNGKNLRSISYDNYYDDTNTTRDFIAAADFGASGSGGYIYTTTAKMGAFAAGGTWTVEDTDNATGTAATTTPRMWSSVVVTNSNGLNGLQIAATEYGGYIWTRTEKHPQYQVTINRGSGTGNGTVYATSSNITWNGDNGTTDNAFVCPDYATLIAQPTDVSSAFDGWVGCDSTSGQECAVSMLSARTVKAVFGLSATDHKMTVTTTGGGTGTVTSSPTGINCGTGGTSCSSNFPDNYTVTLFAAPDNTSVLSSWSGCDNATGYQCNVLLSSNRSVVAVFALASSAAYALNVTKSGTGLGSVTANTGTLTWSGNSGTATYTSGTSVVLTAAPTYGSNFTSWSGCDNTTGTSCTIAISSARSVTATFTLITTPSYALTVTKSGTGSGTVAANSGTLTWSGNTGTASYSSGTSVALTATVNSGSTLSGWSGCDSTNGLICNVTMSSAKSVTATFSSSAISDYQAAYAAFDAIYNQYASLFGSAVGNVNQGTSASATYYVRWYSNGAALVAWTDGLMYTYYNGTWYPLGVSWQSLGKAAAKIASVYSQYTSWFGTTSGSIYVLTSGSATYYVQWYSNGAALVAWTDGYMYTYYNGTWYPAGVSWN
ncbi:MAG: hypothetical protein HQK99_01885 [Nitrospirae bacterium]|nr:hypothetical protein [Nitrospirota bacterium]